MPDNTPGAGAAMRPRLIDCFIVYYLIDAQVTEATMPLQSHTPGATVIIRHPFAIVSSEI